EPAHPSAFSASPSSAPPVPLRCPKTAVRTDGCRPPLAGRRRSPTRMTSAMALSRSLATASLILLVFGAPGDVGHAGSLVVGDPPHEVVRKRRHHSSSLLKGVEHHPHLG